MILRSTASLSISDGAIFFQIAFTWAGVGHGSLCRRAAMHGWASANLRRGVGGWSVMDPLPKLTTPMVDVLLQGCSKCLCRLLPDLGRQEPCFRSACWGVGLR